MIHLRKSSSSQAALTNSCPAFTLTELVVVIGVIVLLAATLLPALASTKFRDQLAVCTANYRQWGVAWLTTASDSSDGSFPSPPPYDSGGGDVWEESLSLVSNMAPYGVTLSMWYCPVRPWVFAQDNAYIQSTLGHPETTLADFIQAVAFLHTPSGGLGIMHHNFWMKRSLENSLSTHNSNGTPNPNANLGLPWPYDWLRKPSDFGAARVPIMTDQIICSGHCINISFIARGWGHPVGGSPSGALYNDNLVYGDGHVETHQADTIAWRFATEYYTTWY